MTTVIPDDTAGPASSNEQMLAHPGAGPECVPGDDHFDRSICPEPCGGMHTYCATCGKVVDTCALNSLPRDEAAEEAARASLLAGQTVWSLYRLDRGVNGVGLFSSVTAAKAGAVSHLVGGGQVAAADAPDSATTPVGAELAWVENDGVWTGRRPGEVGLFDGPSFVIAPLTIQ